MYGEVTKCCQLKKEKVHQREQSMINVKIAS